MQTGMQIYFFVRSSLIASLIRHGRCVLAGDPYQLPPVVKSALAEKYNLGVSLLERLMKDRSVYQEDPNTVRHNPVYITKLVRNYRSRAEILLTPSMRFYSNQLEAWADEVSFGKPTYLTKVMMYTIFS